LGGLTFLRPGERLGVRRNVSIDGMEIRNMNSLGLTRKEWIFNVLGLLVLLALGVV
jgi:hypothetical protein